MEALITLDCSSYSENIEDVLRIFQQIGWNIYNPQGNVEYLPVGDNDAYDWQCEKMSENKLYNIVSNKIIRKEQVGVNLFYDDGAEGVSLLARDTNQILLSIAINRRIVKERHTDMVWYLENIVYKLWDAGIRVLSYELEEFED